MSQRDTRVNTIHAYLRFTTSLSIRIYIYIISYQCILGIITTHVRKVVVSIYYETKNKCFYLLLFKSSRAIEKTSKRCPNEITFLSLSLPLPLCSFFLRDTVRYRETERGREAVWKGGKEVSMVKPFHGRVVAIRHFRLIIHIVFPWRTTVEQRVKSTLSS